MGGGVWAREGRGGVGCWIGEQQQQSSSKQAAAAGSRQQVGSM